MSRPCTFGLVAALVLLIVCVVFPEELFGYRPQDLIGGTFITVCILGCVGYFMWAAVRAKLNKKRQDL
jgi:hypothetical protein